MENLNKTPKKIKQLVIEEETIQPIFSADSGKKYDLIHQLTDNDITAIQVFFYFKPLLISYHTTYAQYELKEIFSQLNERVYIFRAKNGDYKFYSKRELRLLKPIEMILFFVEDINEENLTKLIHKISIAEIQPIDTFLELPPIEIADLEIEIMGNCIPINDSVLSKTKLIQFGTNKYSNKVYWSKKKNSFAFPLKDLSDNFSNMTYYNGTSLAPKKLYFNQNDGYWTSNLQFRHSEKQLTIGLGEEQSNHIKIPFSTTALIFCNPSYIVDYYQKIGNGANQDDFMILLDQENLSYSYYLKSLSLMKEAKTTKIELIVSNAVDLFFATRYISFYLQTLQNSSYRFDIEKENNKLLLTETIELNFSSPNITEEKCLEKFKIGWSAERTTDFEKIITAEFAQVKPSNLKKDGIREFLFFPKPTILHYSILPGKTENEVIFKIHQFTAIPYSTTWINSFQKLLYYTKQISSEEIAITKI